MSGLNKEFNEWWRSDVLLKDNPYSIRTPKYWAWEGWVAGLNAEREACAQTVASIAGDEQYRWAALAIRERGAP